MDTNVLSELMRPDPARSVVAWVAAQPRASLYTTRHNQAEILYGIAVLPVGRRRMALAAAAQAMFDEDLAARVLPFDAAAASCYADMVALRRQAGRRMEAFNALIAATALVAGAGVATRDIADFEGCGLPFLLNPWQA